MSGSHIIEQRRTFERLAGELSLRGWKDFEVSFDADELRIEQHGGRAACSVNMLPSMPVFQAHFIFATTSVRAVSFTIGEEVARGAAPAVVRSFGDTVEAAQWLLKTMESPGLV
ncbi:MAG TPA: hypothetical protein VKT49_16475 [Bryobacteraceae bacterium]|nr:hypothetical protein [Bryobacteraceae bacterium]